MTWERHGIVQNGAVVFSEPLPLPDGTSVAVRIAPLADTEAVRESPAIDSFRDLPFFGMWSDREEMQDSAEWVRQERGKWRQRTEEQGSSTPTS